MQMMSPLLFAYEERIAELEAVIERSVSLAEQAQVLTKENDSLRLELHERTEQLRNAQILAPVHDVNAFTGDQQEDLQELYKLSVEQNEALAQQNQLLKLQIDRMHQSSTAAQQQMQQSMAAAQQQLHEVQSRAVEGAKAFAAEQERTARSVSSEQERWAKALVSEQEKVAAEKERIEVLARQRIAAEQRLEELTGELVEEVRSRERLQSQLETLRHDMKLQQQSLDMYRKSTEDRTSLEQDEQARTQAELERVSRREREQHQRVIELEKSLLETSDHLSVSRRDGSAAKQEVERMLPLMLSMDKRLKDISERHDHVHGQLLDEEAQVSHLLMERDLWSTSEQGLKKQTERLEVRLQAEAEACKNHAPRHELEGLRSAHRRLSAEMDEQLRKSEQSVSELQAQVHLLDKQRAWEAAAGERQSSVHTAERERYRSDLEEAQQVRLKLERQLDAAQQEASRVQAELSRQSAEARELAGRTNVELAGSKSRCQSLEQQLGRARSEVHASEALVANSADERSRVREELKQERLRSEESVEAERRKFVGERHGLERQLQQLRSKAQQDEHRACELLKAQESLRLRWQAELGLEKEGLEAQVERLVKENRTMRERSRGVLKALAVRRASGEEVVGGSARRDRSLLLEDSL